MKNVRFGTFWESLRSSYWFVPTLMAAIAIALSFGMLTLDQMGKSGPIQSLSWIYTGGPDGARTVLSTIAGSTITVAGTVFSIVIVALTLTSSQFGPRLLRNFMQDTGNQLVLGTFIATFIYCLLVLRTVRGDDYNVFVPQISVTVGLLLGIASIGVLIYFIHHASTSIQAWHVIGEVGRDLEHEVNSLFPKNLGESPPKERWVAEIPLDFESQSQPILSEGYGYLQVLDEEKLMKIAHSHDLLLRLNYRPGHFIVQGAQVARVWPGERASEQLIQQINQAFILGKQRTENQDIEFSINQLVEIASRAISPGINDPFTAIQCIDQLNAALCRLAQKEFPSPYRYDRDRQLRIITNPVTFVGLINSAFNQIRQYGRSDVAVSIRLLEAIATIAGYTRTSKDRETLLHHAQMIARNSCEVIFEESDKNDVQERYYAVLKALDQHF